MCCGGACAHTVRDQGGHSPWRPQQQGLEGSETPSSPQLGMGPRRGWGGTPGSELEVSWEQGPEGSLSSSDGGAMATQRSAGLLTPAPAPARCSKEGCGAPAGCAPALGARCLGSPGPPPGLLPARVQGQAHADPASSSRNDRNDQHPRGARPHLLLGRDPRALQKGSGRFGPEALEFHAAGVTASPEGL